MKAFLLIVSSLLLFITGCSENNQTASGAPPAYTNTSLPVNERVNDLVSRMTLSEKIGQLYNDAPAIKRLNVPAYDWWNEALHGVARAGKATVFPQAIGLAASFDEQLIGAVATAISDEARAKHHYFAANDIQARYTGLTFWSPNVNIFRDPRWGRGQETYGEDPYLTSALAIQFIQGLQGDDPRYLKSAAMAKHFAVHSGPEKSRHSDNYHSTAKDLHETYLPAFKAAVQDANVESIMCAYNRVNDLPACGSDPLLKEILRGDWGFEGHVVSDCGALADFYGPNDHALVWAPAEAAAWALKSGTDLNCGTGRLSTFANLNFALQKDMVSINDIDTAVKRLFTTRFKLGFFDPAEHVSYTQIPKEVIGSDKHQALTLKAAEQSLVLLKNDGVLPLKEGTRIAVIGPNATNPSILVGNYHGTPIQPVLPLDGIRARAGDDLVYYAPGSPLIADQYGHYRVISAKHLFHYDSNNALTPGLKAHYYKADLQKGKLPNSAQVDQIAARVGEPVISRIDDKIDFYWERSPVDNQVRGEFGITWDGILVPQKSGVYLFKTDSNATLQIAGETITGPIELSAGEHYTLHLHRTYLRTTWGNPVEPSLQLSWVNSSESYTADAVTAAQKADVIIFAGGISAELEGEEMDVELEGFDHGDRTDLRLPTEQRQLLKILHALGKPIVMVNFSGSAVALNWEDKNLNAIVQAFYPGEGTGTALARLLWGDFNPSGRLPVTFYRSVKDLPDFKDYSFANRTYRYFDGDVLYPFGHGLSYTPFSYSDLNTPNTLKSGNDLSLDVSITNNGAMSGGEIAQLYIAMPDAPVKTPIQELKGFRYVSITAGETTQVAFTLTAKQLQFVDNDGNFRPYKGRLELSVGSGQPNYATNESILKTSIQID